MAPAQKVTKTTTTVVASRSKQLPETSLEDHGNGGVPPDSQDEDQLSLEKMAKEMTERTRRRRDARRTELDIKYAQRVAKAESDIKGLYEDHKNKVTKLRHANINRLRQLITQRMEIESKIAASVKKLEDSYANANRDLHVILSHRAAA